jgi:hypothetical protein
MFIYVWGDTVVMLTYGVTCRVPPGYFRGVVRRLDVGILRIILYGWLLNWYRVLSHNLYNICFMDALIMVQFGNVSMIFSYLVEDIKKNPTIRL